MQGQVVMQMTNPVAVNQPTKVTVNAKTGNNANSNNAGSFASEFKNAADNISESNLGEAVTEQNVANILNVLAPIGLTNLIVNNLNAPVTESVKQQGIAEIGVVSAVPSTAQVQTNNFLLSSNNLNSEGSVEIKGQVDNNVELPLVDLKNDKEIIQTVQNKIPTNQVAVAISPVVTQQATSAEIATLKPTQLPNNLQSSAENNVQILDETTVKVPMVAENVAPITVNKSNDVVKNNIVASTDSVVKNNIVASVDPVVTSTVASQDKINTNLNTNNKNIAGTKDNQIKNVGTVDSPEIAVNPQVKPQGQNQSSAQSKQSFSGMMEQLPPTVQKSETISGNDIFAHNLDVSNKAVNTTGVEQVEKQLTTTEKMDIPNQIIQQTKVIKGIEDTQMVIKLKPEHLGELTLKFVLDKGAVSASFHSDNQQVRNIIESSLVQLKQELADQGIKISHMGVYAGLGDLLSNGQQEQRQSQQAKTKNRKADVTDFEDEVDKITNIKGVLSEDSVDYRI